MPGGATRSGTFRRMQASATSGVDRPANPVSIPARPGSIPVTRPTLPAATETILNAGAAPRFPAPRTPGPLCLRRSIPADLYPPGALAVDGASVQIRSL